MKHPWQNLGQEVFVTHGPEWREPYVLLEYDGPRLVTLKADDGDYIGVAADEDDTAVRWLLALISQLEREALVLGGATVWSALYKERVLVIDYAHNDHRKLHVWEIDPDNVPEPARPAPGALLPAAVRKHLLDDWAHAFASNGAEPAFDLGGKAHILFDDLSAVTSTIQKLWNAIADEMGVGMPTLAAEAVREGSLKLKVYTSDTPLFARIAERYRRLTLANDSPVTLDRALAEAAPPLVAAYRNYLDAVARHRVEVLATWSDGAAFVRPHLAQRSKQRIAERPATEILTRETIRRRGRFQWFWGAKNPRFEFRDDEVGETLTGKIERALLERVRRDFDLTLGIRSRYEATIVVERRGNERPSYTLQDYSPAPDAP